MAAPKCELCEGKLIPAGNGWYRCESCGKRIRVAGIPKAERPAREEDPLIKVFLVGEALMVIAAMWLFPLGVAADKAPPSPAVIVISKIIMHLRFCGPELLLSGLALGMKGNGRELMAVFANLISVVGTVIWGLCALGGVANQEYGMALWFGVLTLCYGLALVLLILRRRRDRAAAANQ